MARIVTGMSFGKAICEHFGINSEKVSSDYKLHTSIDEVFSVTLNITLEAKDIEEIGKLMK